MPPVREPSRFPPPESADADGLLGVGGELGVDWLIDAYRHGIFPWPVFPDPDLLAWWSPDPRAIFELDGFHVSRRLRRTIRSGRSAVTFNQSFRQVICQCATVGDRAEGTWITPPLLQAYCDLHAAGAAHSVEVWRDDRLVGGVYGVAIGGLFAGESMFHLQRDASKVALAALVERLREQGFVLFDIQQLTPHTESMGAVEIARATYLDRLAEALDVAARFD